MLTMPVTDERKCFGCGKTVPNKLRPKLSVAGWDFLELHHQTDNLVIYSCCGCMDFEAFVASATQDYFRRCAEDGETALVAPEGNVYDGE